MEVHTAAPAASLQGLHRCLPPLAVIYTTAKQVITLYRGDCLHNRCRWTVNQATECQLILFPHLCSPLLLVHFYSPVQRREWVCSPLGAYLELHRIPAQFLWAGSTNARFVPIRAQRHKGSFCEDKTLCALPPPFRTHLRFTFKWQLCF